ncbi:MAG: hypothetical protein OET44_15580 [Gammaproteobacteria bacterium]|nr:hypothetical protein [Gammaproteobacteria bacterium]
MRLRPVNAWRRHLNPFDLIVAAGGVVNIVVVGYLIAYWVLHG